MKAVVQRVKEAEVRVDGSVVARIGQGLLVLLGVEKGDGVDQAGRLARRIAEMRVFFDDRKATNLSLTDIGGEALVVSQFTLCADLGKGRRPSFFGAAAPAEAEPIYDFFRKEMEQAIGRSVATGRFGAMMEVASVNDGPATYILEESPHH